MLTQSRDFQESINDLSAFATRHGLKHLIGDGVGSFSGLSDQEKNLAIMGLKKFGTLLQDLEKEVPDFSNSKQLLKAVLEKLGFYLPEGVLDKVKSNDFLEIYTSDFVPAFKSPNFWGMSSYNLETLYSHDYKDLFERDEFYQASIARSAKKVFSGEQAFIENPVPKHVAWEKAGPFKCSIQYRFFSVVRDSDNDTVGILVACDITQLSH